MERKFLTEYSLEYTVSYTFQIKAHYLSSSEEIPSEIIDELNKCHIYFITKNPNFYFRKDSIICNQYDLSGYICYKINGVEKEEYFSFPYQIEKKTLFISCEYPYKELTILYENEDGVQNVLCTVTVYEVCYVMRLKIFSDYEVLYIGQSFGRNGDRNAMDRLKSHSTLQKILAETSHNDPDSEITLFMYAFEYEHILSCTDGADPSVNNSNENIERLYDLIQNPPDKKKKGQTKPESHFGPVCIMLLYCWPLCLPLLPRFAMCK